MRLRNSLTDEKEKTEFLQENKVLPNDWECRCSYKVYFLNNFCGNYPLAVKNINISCIEKFASYKILFIIITEQNNTYVNKSNKCFTLMHDLANFYGVCGHSESIKISFNTWYKCTIWQKRNTTYVLYCFMQYHDKLSIIKLQAH